MLRSVCVCSFSQRPYRKKESSMYVPHPIIPCDHVEFPYENPNVSVHCVEQVPYDPHLLALRNLIPVECMRFLHSRMHIHTCMGMWESRMKSYTFPCICNIGQVSYDVWKHAGFCVFMWGCWMGSSWIFFDRNSYNPPIIGAGKRGCLYSRKVFFLTSTLLDCSE